MGTGGPPRDKTSGLGIWRGFRTKTHVYARFLDGRRFLFNRNEDPLEMNNLALDNKFSELVLGMENRLQKWLKDTEDPFDYGNRNESMDILKVGQAFSHNC